MTDVPDRYAPLDAAFEAFHARENLPGLAWGFVSRNAPPHLRAVGSADLDTRRPAGTHTAFRIASMTKCFTALAVLRLRDQGRLRLDDAVADTLPEIARSGWAAEDCAPITLRDLLCHLAGFVNDDPWADRHLGMAQDGLLRLLDGGVQPSRPPRQEYEYSNLGYAILGLVIERLTGRSYSEHIEDIFLRPLGMMRSGFDRACAGDDYAVGYRNDGPVAERMEPDGAFSAIGGLWTTPEDYARFCAFVLDAWPPRDGAQTGPVRRAAVRELALGYGLPLGPGWHPDAPPDMGAAVYGYGMVCACKPGMGRHMHHAGGLPGYGSWVIFMPDRGAALFVFGNHTYAKVVPTAYGVAAELAALAEPPAIPVSDALARAAAHVLRAYQDGGAAPLMPHLADNVLLDLPAPVLQKRVAALRARWGPVRSHTLRPQHAQAGALTLACERGELSAHLTLTPLRDGKLQAIRWKEPEP